MIFLHKLECMVSRQVGDSRDRAGGCGLIEFPQQVAGMLVCQAGTVCIEFEASWGIMCRQEGWACGLVALWVGD